MAGQWKWYDWVLFVIRILVFVSVLYNASVVQEQFTIPFWIIIIAIGLSFIIPFLLLFKSRKLYFFSEIIFLILLTPLFSLLNATLVGNFITYSIMLGFYNDPRSKRWTIPVSIAVILISPIPSLFVDYITYISVLVSGLVFYGLGIIFNALLYTKQELQTKNEIIEQQYKVLEQYSKQMEQNAILQERNRISTSLQHSVSDTFASLIFQMQSVQQKLKGNEGEKHLHTLIEYTYREMASVRDSLNQLKELDFDIPLKEIVSNIIDNVQKTTTTTIKLVVMGEENTVAKQMIVTISTCLQELLTNSIKMGNAKLIVVTLQFDANKVELRIEDDGNASELERRQSKLVHVTEQLSLLKGELILSSFLDKGNISTCRIPIDIEEDTMKVLVIDENPFVRESLSSLLELQGNCKVIGHADTKEEAVLLCKEKQPDVILIDSNKDLFGLDLTKQLKQLNPLAKIIVLTNTDSVEEAIETIHAGAEGYISKNIPPRDLITKIKLVYMGESIISQAVAKQLIEQMKHTDQSKANTEKWKQEHGLTDREIEVLQCLASGLKYKEISEKLFLAEGTVRNYISNIYSKLEVSDREQATEKAVQGGLL